MAEVYAFQEIMNKKMAAEKWSQHEVARRISEKVGRKIHASTITRLLAAKVTIPGGDVLYALAEIFETEPYDFISSVYKSRYAENDLAALSDFVRREFQEASEADRRRILEYLRSRQGK